MLIIITQSITMTTAETTMTLQTLLQDKDPHIDELNATTTTTYTYADDDKGVKCRHSEERGWECIEEYCLNCGDPARNCDCGDYRCGGWFCEEGSGWNDADPEGEVCCKCGETNDQKGNPNSEVEHYEELEDWYCGRCYEATTRDDEEKDELNAAIDASGNCFH